MKFTTMNKFFGWTDGSCNYKTEQGGIGVLIKQEIKGEHHQDSYKISKQISEGYFPTTIGRMELKAIIECLKYISDNDSQIIITTDSEYIVNSVMKGFLFNWEKEGFVFRKNSDLWKEFLTEYKRFTEGNIVLKHVKGHSGIEENEICDKLCSYKQFKTYKTDLSVKERNDMYYGLK